VIVRHGECAAGKAEKARRFGSAQNARRQAGQWIEHERPPWSWRQPPDNGGKSKATMAKQPGVGGATPGAATKN